MAKVTHGPLVVEARNRLGNITHRVPPKSSGPLETYQGGVVFVRTRAGPVARSYVEPKYKRTAHQADVRDAMKAAIASWQHDLTDLQRAAWDAFAAQTRDSGHVDGKHTLSGYQRFIKHNYVAHWLPAAPLLDPPADLSIDTMSGFVINQNQQSPSPLSLTCSYAGSPTCSIIVYSTLPLSPGIRYFGHICYALQLLPPPFTWPHDVTDAYALRFGPRPAGKRIGMFARFVNLTNMVLGPQLSASSITATPTPSEDTMLSAKVTITSAQLKDLIANPVPLIAAPGAAKMLHLISLAFTQGPGTQPYNQGTTGSTLAIFTWSPTYNRVTNFFSDICLGAFGPDSGTLNASAAYNSPGYSGLYENRPLVLGNNGTSDWVDGDFDLTLLLDYTIEDLS